MTRKTNAVKTKANGSEEKTNTMTTEVNTRHNVLFVVQSSTSASRTTGGAETGYECIRILCVTATTVATEVTSYPSTAPTPSCLSSVSCAARSCS